LWTALISDGSITAVYQFQKLFAPMVVDVLIQSFQAAQLSHNFPALRSFKKNMGFLVG